MKCRKCHTEIPDESKFCLRCGAKQTIKQGCKSRGNGQGTAIKRGKTWTAIWTEAIYITEPEEGQPDMDRRIHQKRRWKGGFKSKTEALAYAASPPEKAPKIPTLRHYWKLWENSDYKDLSKSRKDAFKIAWDKLAPLAQTPMNELTIEMLQACVDSKAKTHYPAKDMRTVLSHLFKRAVAEGTARTNLSEYIRIPALQEKESQPFTEEELHKLWKAYEAGDRIVGFVLLMIYTGMMPGELLKLQADMVQWDTCEIIGGGIKTKQRKVTPIVFPAMISSVLEDLIEGSRSTKGYVLGMNKDKFYKDYYESLRRAGVRELPPYSCRHTTATALALGKEVAPSVIQKVMRHSKFSTTEKYIHPDMRSAHEAINTLGKGTSCEK